MPERTYQLNYNTINDDPFGDGQTVPAKSIIELADLIEQHVIKGDYCDVSIVDDNTSTGSCQLYHRNNPEIFTESLGSWGSADSLIAELNASRGQHNQPYTEVCPQCSGPIKVLYKHGIWCCSACSIKIAQTREAGITRIEPMLSFRIDPLEIPKPLDR